MSCQRKQYFIFKMNKEFTFVIADYFQVNEIGLNIKACALYSV